jgi:hypothetical protein
MEKGMVSLTQEEVISVLGPVHDVVIAEIVATQSMLEELTRAWAWVNNDEALISEGRELPTGRIAELVRLLSPEDGEP